MGWCSVLHKSGQGQANSAVLATVLRILVSSGTLPRNEMEQYLKDIIGMFSRPTATEADSVAAGIVINILDNASKPLPET